MSQDPIEQFKAVQRESWASFGPMELLTSAPAACLTRFAQIRAGQSVLDVACGTGVVAVTAARLGAKVQGLDLSPVLVEHARGNAATARLDISFCEGDVEKLPFADASFDVVLSQFGHMFAPRPAVAIAEMLRVLRPGGRIAFSTWPPEHFVGAMFMVLGRYSPPPPPGVSPPPEWGNVNIVRERLGDAVQDLVFERDIMIYPTLSPALFVRRLEVSIGPISKLVSALEATAPERVAELRKELEALSSLYFADNAVRQHFLMTRATKR